MNRHVLVGLTAVVSAAAGTVAGYFISKRRLVADYEKRLDEEVAATKAHMNSVAKNGLFRRVPGEELDPEISKETEKEQNEKAVIPPGSEVLEKVVRGLRYGPPNIPVDDPKPTFTSALRNIFDAEELDEDEVREWAEVIKARTPERPYIISVDEFGAMDGYSRVNLTYYILDDGLIDEDEVPIEDIDLVVGEQNLDRFGYHSGDPRLIYIRNDKLQADYEILLHEGSFGEVVHGEVSYRGRRNPKKRNKR